jgi:hypothetical protein
MRLGYENQRKKHHDGSNAGKVFPPKIHISILRKKDGFY